MENKQTAVEWLVEQLAGHDLFNTRTGNSFRNHNNMMVIEELINQAKEMEKQQIIEAHFAAQKEDLRFWDEAKQEALEYYNETFKLE